MGHLVGELRLGAPAGSSGWELRLGAPVGSSGWELQLGAPAGSSAWELRLGVPVGSSGWDIRLGEAKKEPQPKRLQLERCDTEEQCEKFVERKLSHVLTDIMDNTFGTGPRHC